MLIKIRKTAIGLSAMLTLALPSMAQDNGVVIDKVVAIIGRQIVMYSDIETQKMQIKAQNYAVPEDIDCQILEQGMYQKLLVNQAIVDTVEVSETQVNAETDRRINYYVSQIGSEEKLEEYYKKSMDEIREDLLDIVKEQLTAQNMEDEVTRNVTVTPQEVRDCFKSLPKDSLPMINTEFEIEQLSVSPKIEETEILRIKDRLREFKDRVAKGESFATLAVLYSEDPGSAMKGGELGFMSRNDLVAEFSAVAFNLVPNEVSKVVKTEYGYHIIQLIEKRGERMNCRHILLKPQISANEKKNAMLRLDTIRQKIVNKEITFKEACWMFSDDEDTRLNGGVMLNPYTGTSLFEAEQLDPKVATAIRNLEVGEISKPFEAEDDQGNTVCKIVLLRSKTSPHKANLAQDYQRIQNLAIEKKKGDVLEDWLAKTIESTYIKIDDDFKKCKFHNKEWLKTDWQ
ncbi:MAG: peptidylprolyl isomerase [Salinivirgaceae bacterium]|nr:peptidylprolyl isomerase [Salinivirgaceae bacterium]